MDKHSVCYNETDRRRAKNWICDLHNKHRNELQTLSHYYTTPFLVLDEVGKGDDAVIAKMFVACVLAARYDNNLPTLITTNMNAEELGEFVGKDIKSRFFETAQIYTLDGADLRRG